MTFDKPINTENIEDRDFSPIPAGWYGAQVVSNKDRSTSTGGMQTCYEYKILGPSFAGRKVFSNHNVVCPSSSKAQEIAYEEIGRLGKACGVMNIRDTQDVVGKICEIEVKQRATANGTVNEVNTFRTPKAQYAAEPVAAPVQASAPARANTSNAPWFTEA